LIQKRETELEFSDFVEPSDFDYLWRIINHLDNCYNESELRNIISCFRPRLQDLVNEQQYSKGYYRKLLWMKDNYPLDDDQKRIIALWIKNYKQRGIDLPQNKQDEIKNINKEYSKQSEIFQHNVVDDQAGFLYHLEDDSTLKEMPKATLEKAKKIA
jgi:peptidyl-dipeptidase Dcp